MDRITKRILGWGGNRPGSGRPKLNKSEKKEPTKTIRVPVSKIDEVKKLISE